MNLLNNLLKPMKEVNGVQQQQIEKQEEINSMKGYVESKFTTILSVLYKEDIVTNQDNKLTTKGIYVHI